MVSHDSLSPANRKALATIKREQFTDPRATISDVISYLTHLYEQVKGLANGKFPYLLPLVTPPKPEPIIKPQHSKTA